MTAVWAEQAGYALGLALGGERAAAHGAVQRLVAEHGDDVMVPVLLAWIDHVLRVTGHRPGAPVAIAFAVVGDDTMRGADEVGPAARFAGRLLAARAADDEAQARALIDAVETDEQWARNVAGVLDMCATTLHRFQTGWPVLLRRQGGDGRG